MICAHCGAKNRETAIYCRECGKKLDEIAEDISDRETEALEVVEEEEQERIPHRRRKPSMEETIVFSLDEKDPVAGSGEEAEEEDSFISEEEFDEEFETVGEEPEDEAGFEEELQSGEEFEETEDAHDDEPGEEDEAENEIAIQKNLCPVCGTENPEGAVFCFKCGEPISGEEGRRAAAKKKKAAGAGAKIGKMIKISFKNPMDAARMAKKDGDCWLTGLIVYLGRDFLVSLITALIGRQLAYGSMGSYTGDVGDFLGMSAFKLFILLFFTLVICDALVLLLAHVFGKAFGSSNGLKNMIGGQTPAGLIGGIGSIVSLVLMCLGTGGAVVGLIISMIVSVWVLILFWKSFEIVTEIDEKKVIYSFLTGVSASTVAIVIVVLVMTVIAGAMMYSSGVNNITDAY